MATAEREKKWRAEIVAYADDFVILSRGNAAEARMWTQKVMARIGLTLNEQKTSIRDARTEHFDFLGYTFGHSTGGRPEENSWSHSLQRRA